MASRTIVIRTDDMDGSEGAETIGFGLEGVSYELDLAPANAQKLRDALEPFLARARRVGGGRGRGRGRSRTAESKDLTGKMREWARSEGYEVSDRGRLPASVVQAYEDAH